MPTAKINEKGVALIAAIDARLCAENMDGYEVDKFELFWKKFIEGLVEQRCKGRYNFGNLGDKISGKSANQRIKYLKTVITTLFFLFAGFLIGFFF